MFLIHNGSEKVSFVFSDREPLQLKMKVKNEPRSFYLIDAFPRRRSGGVSSHYATIIDRLCPDLSSSPIVMGDSRCTEAARGKFRHRVAEVANSAWLALNRGD